MAVPHAYGGLLYRVRVSESFPVLVVPSEAPSRDKCETMQEFLFFSFVSVRDGLFRLYCFSFCFVTGFVLIVSFFVLFVFIAI